MPLYLQDKQKIVTEVASVASNALSVVAADYRGITSPQMTQLRAEARKTGVDLMVVRNTLAKRAFADTSYSCMNDVLVGSVILAFAKDEPGASARLLRDFAKTNNKLQIRALSLGGKLYDASQVDVVANLPTKEEAIARLMSVMQAPIVKLARTIAEPKAKLVRTVMAVRDKKEQG